MIKIVKNRQDICEIAGVLSSEFCQTAIEKFNNSSEKIVDYETKDQEASDHRRSPKIHISTSDDWIQEERLLESRLLSAVRLFLKDFEIYPAMSCSGFEMVEYPPGRGADIHVDGPITGPENPIRALSAVFFVNSIRRGGFLKFPRQNRTIKPEMGNLVLFPPFFSHPHLTMPAQGEPRYVFVTWLTYI